jgi:hypothetical protein
VNSRAALYAQAIRGPILLIAIGVLFAMQQGGVLPFSRTWPLLIIIIGVVKLIERMFIRPATPVPPSAPPTPPSGGSWQ